MATSKKLIGKRVRIVSENENYSEFKDTVLICTHADNNCNVYDSVMFPMMLCDFDCEDGSVLPFALYEYEFEII